MVVVVFAESEVQVIQIVLVLVHQISGVDARRVDRRRRRWLGRIWDHGSGPDLGEVLLADQGHVLTFLRLLRVDLNEKKVKAKFWRVKPFIMA